MTPDTSRRTAATALTPEKARRELRHLRRLLDKQSWSDRMWATGRGAAGFTAAYVVAAKFLLLKTLGAKLAFGAVVALFAVLPFLIGWLLATLALFLVIFSVVALICGEAVDIGGMPDVPCDLCEERKRRKQLKAMIAEREVVLRAAGR